jgi:hypothetical protein
MKINELNIQEGIADVAKSATATFSRGFKAGASGQHIAADTKGAPSASGKSPKAGKTRDLSRFIMKKKTGELDEGPLGTGVGATLGAAAGSLAGPLGAAGGAALGGYVGNKVGNGVSNLGKSIKKAWNGDGNQQAPAQGGAGKAAVSGFAAGMGNNAPVGGGSAYDTIAGSIKKAVEDGTLTKEDLTKLTSDLQSHAEGMQDGEAGEAPAAGPAKAAGDKRKEKQAAAAKQADASATEPPAQQGQQAQPAQDQSQQAAPQQQGQVAAPTDDPELKAAKDRAKQPPPAPKGKKYDNSQATDAVVKEPGQAKAAPQKQAAPQADQYEKAFQQATKKGDQKTIDLINKARQQAQQKAAPQQQAQPAKQAAPNAAPAQNAAPQQQSAPRLPAPAAPAAAPKMNLKASEFDYDSFINASDEKPRLGGIPWK